MSQHLIDHVCFEILDFFAVHGFDKLSLNYYFHFSPLITQNSGVYVNVWSKIKSWSITQKQEGTLNNLSFAGIEISLGQVLYAFKPHVFSFNINGMILSVKKNFTCFG